MTGPDNDFTDEGRVNDPVGAAIRATRMPIVVSDALQPDNPLVFANDAFLKLSGFTREEALGRNCRFMQGPETDPAQIERIRQAVRHGHDVSVEIVNYRKDGTRFWNALNISPVRNAQGRVHYFFGSQLDVTEQKAAETELRHVKDNLEHAVAVRTRDLQAALDQRTVLLHEIDHRVKNNLQLISSLMLLQSRRTENPAVADALKRMLQRLNALSTVHRRLFQADDAACFDLADFVSDLAGDVAAVEPGSRVAIAMDLEPVDAPAAQAAPIALLLGELIGNAVGHAFPDGRAGQVSLRLRRTEQGAAIEVADDGVGMTGRPDGFGATIVKLLSRQLSATVSYEQGAGVTARVDLPLRRAGAG